MKLRRAGSLVVVIAVMATVATGMLAVTEERATEFYVAPDGEDGNDGSLGRPWRTIARALDELLPGDTLYLRDGIYYESGIEVEISGTEEAPIIIQSFPGERAIVDGGIPDFRETGQAAWEVVDGDIALYRSRQTFALTSDFVRAWLVDDDVQLVEYESDLNLRAINYGPLNAFEPVFVGPGLRLGDDGHLYIRLAYNPNDLSDASGNPITPRPVDTDPNNNRIAVFFSETLFRLDRASYLQFKDIDFAHANYIMDVRSGSHHVTLSGCHMNFGNYGLVLRDGVSDWEITGCEFSNGTPQYIYWTDVKNRDQEVGEAYPEFQSVAISGAMPGFYIHDNLFRDTFDGITVKDGTTNARIVANLFRELRDDAINLSRGIGNVEVSGNLMWHVMSGISNLGSMAEPGQVYIHHNVIDNSSYHRGGRPGNYREQNWPVWTIGSPFADHDAGEKSSWWKLYNNTVVTRLSPGHVWAAAGPDAVTGNPEKFVFNNVFFVLDERVIFRNDLAAYGSHYDGNVVYRAAPGNLPLFSDFGDGGRYGSMLEFQTNSGTGWETMGLEIDPQFDLLLLNEDMMGREETWQRYRPRNSQVLTPGASYEGFTWPGTDGVDYRGAVSGP